MKPTEDKKPYEFTLQSEAHQKSETLVDKETGWRYEYWDVGMVRNAKEENKKQLKVFLDPIPHAVLDQNVPLRGWYKSKFEPSSVRPRPCYTEALLTQPYGGTCPVGCAFCYINNGVRGYRGQGLTVVDPHYPEKIAKQLAKMRMATSFYISSFIEPFCALEPHYHNTEKTARLAIENGLPIFFLTRQVPPPWAFSLLEDNKYNYLQFSINTSSREDWKRLSPRAARLDDLMGAIREARTRHIYVSIQCNPIVAGITSIQDIEALMGELGGAGASHVIFKHVEIVFSSVNVLIETMRKRFGDRAKRFEALFTQNIGGLRTIEEEYRKEALERYAKAVKKAGMTMGLCYEYEFGEKGGSTGVSLGPKFTTAAQCHGMRVPVHYRENLSSPFKPFEGCPPSGCLYCAEASGGEDKVPCGNPKMAQARALGPRDYLPCPVWCEK